LRGYGVTRRLRKTGRTREEALCRSPLFRPNGGRPAKRQRFFSFVPGVTGARLGLEDAPEAIKTHRSGQIARGAARLYHVSKGALRGGRFAPSADSYEEGACEE
jgi:hypothetical protein